MTGASIRYQGMGGQAVELTMMSGMEAFASGHHNVVGGRIGVFEGNGGDLRIGLSRQLLNDGARWMHAPLRLSVMIDAPVGAIDRHEALRQLLDNRWVHLIAIEGETELSFFRRRCEGA